MTRYIPPGSKLTPGPVSKVKGVLLAESQLRRVHDALGLIRS